MKKAMLLVGLACAIGGALADDYFTVVKSEIKDISADTDVSVRGTRIVGITANSKNYTVNDQVFLAGYGWSANWDPYFWFSGTAYRTCGNNGDTTILPGSTTLSTDYKNALNGLKKGGTTSAVSYGRSNCGLRGFQVGKTYELQIWVSNAAAGTDQTVTITVGGRDFVLRPNTGDGLGQYLTVEMIAHVESSDRFYFYGDGSTFPGQYNMLQVRQVENGTTPSATYTWSPAEAAENPLWLQTGTNWKDSEGAAVSGDVSLWSDDAGFLNKAEFPSGSDIYTGANVYADTVSVDGDAVVSNDYFMGVSRFSATGKLSLDGYGTLVVGETLSFDGVLELNNGALVANGTVATTGPLTAKPNAGPITVETTTRFDAAKVSFGQSVGIRLENSGDGQFSSGAELELTTPSDVAFTGLLSSPKLVKKGSGTLTYTGYSSGQTEVSVLEGGLKLGSPLKLPGVVYDFDASDAESVTVTDGVLSWKDQAGVRTFAYQDLSSSDSDSLKSTPATYDTSDYFGGRGAVTFADKDDPTSHTQLRLDAAQSYGSVFIVYWEDVIRSYAQIMGETENRRQGIGRRNSATAGSNNNRWARRVNSDGSISGTLINTSENEWARISQGKAELVYVASAGDTMRTDKSHMLGSCATATSAGINYAYCGAIGEVLAFSRDVTHPERRVISKYLAAKWGVGTDVYQPINPEATVSVASGAKLDLGEFVGLAVKDVELAAGSAVAVDELPESGAILSLSSGTAARYDGVRLFVGGRDRSGAYRLAASAEALYATKIAGMCIVIR